MRLFGPRRDLTFARNCRAIAFCAMAHVWIAPMIFVPIGPIGWSILSPRIASRELQFARIPERMKRQSSAVALKTRSTNKE